MRPSASDFMEAAKQKRKAGGESARPPKRSRTGRAGRAPAPVAPAAPEVAEEPAREMPVGEEVPSQAGTGAAERGASAVAGATVIVDLEEGEHAAAAEVPEAGQMTEREGEKAPAAVAGEPAGRKTDVAEGSAGSGETAGDPESVALAALRLSRPRVEGAQEGLVRLAPLLSSMRDAAQAARLLPGLQTSESVEEVRKLGSGAIFDTIMVSVVQMANGALALRDAMSRASDSLAKARERTERYGKEALAGSQKLARLQDELKAQERSRKEAERRAGESASRVSQLEAELKTVQARAEEQARQLGQAQEWSVAARNEIEAAARRATVAEEAAVKAGQHAAEAVARAEEAKAHACTLEDELKKAKAEAEGAVEKYKSSPEFTKELVEGGLDAFMKGFDTGKARVSTVLKIDSAEIDKVQLADEEESAEEGDDEAGAGADEP